MMEFKAGEHNYRCGKLSALTQFHVCRRLIPSLAEFAPLLKQYVQAARAATAKGVAVKFDGWDALEPLGNALAAISDDDCNYVIFACLDATERQGEGSLWSKLRTQQGVMMFSDMEMPEMIQIVWCVLQGHLESFFSMLPQISSDAA